MEMASGMEETVKVPEELKGHKVLEVLLVLLEQEEQRVLKALEDK